MSGEGQRACVLLFPCARAAANRPFTSRTVRLLPRRFDHLAHFSVPSAIRLAKSNATILDDVKNGRCCRGEATVLATEGLRCNDASSSLSLGPGRQSGRSQLGRSSRPQNRARCPSLDFSTTCPPTDGRQLSQHFAEP